MTYFCCLSVNTVSGLS